MGELRSAVDALAAVDPDDLEPSALSGLVAEVLAQTDRLMAIGHRLVAAHDRLRVWKAEGAHSEKQWLAQHCRLTPGEAAGRARTARHLDLLPATAQAAVAGEIGAAQARVAANAVRDLPREALDGLDRLVAEQGPGGDAGRLRTAVDDYAHRAAPESLEERERRAYERRRLSVTNTGDGGAVLDGYLDVLGAETVLTALAPLAAPRGADDDRTPEQRHADALTELARRSLGGRVRAGGQRSPEGGDQGASAGTQPASEGGDQGASAGAQPASEGGDQRASAGAQRPAEGADRSAGSGGQRPHVTVVVDLEALLKERGAPPAVLDRLGALSGEAARLLACDARVSRVITAGPSQILDAGRATRTVTSAQRRALTVRDRGCVGCQAPAGWCEAHHVRFWSEGGETDLRNLVLLCHRCHRDVHHRSARPGQRPDGTWTLLRLE